MIGSIVPPSARWQRRLSRCASASQDFVRARTTSKVASTSGSAISSISRTRPASTWNAKATLTVPATNPGGAELAVDGRHVPPLGSR